MAGEIIVHPRVRERHPEITDEDVRKAWANCVRSAVRHDTGDVVAVGIDERGRLVEIIARRVSVDALVVYHAFSPPTKKMLMELGLSKRR